MKYLPLVILIPLIRLIVADFRRREVSIVWLAVLAVGTVCVPVLQHGWQETFTRIWQNMLLLSYLGTGIVIWSLIKARRFVNPVNTYIGMGDLVFFAALIPLFPVRTFTWLMVASMLFSLVWWQAARLRGKQPVNVPLVSTSGIVMGCAVIFNVFFG